MYYVLIHMYVLNYVLMYVCKLDLQVMVAGIPYLL